MQGLSWHRIKAIADKTFVLGKLSSLSNVIFANKDISVVRNLSKMLTTSYYKIKCSKDVVGVAACGGIKNIYAMIVGTSMGTLFLPPVQLTYKSPTPAKFITVDS